MATRSRITKRRPARLPSNRKWCTRNTPPPRQIPTATRCRPAIGASGVIRRRRSPPHPPAACRTAPDVTHRRPGRSWTAMSAPCGPGAHCAAHVSRWARRCTVPIPNPTTAAPRRYEPVPRRTSDRAAAAIPIAAAPLGTQKTRPTQRPAPKAIASRATDGPRTGSPPPPSGSR